MTTIQTSPPPTSSIDKKSTIESSPSNEAQIDAPTNSSRTSNVQERSNPGSPQLTSAQEPIPASGNIENDITKTINNIDGFPVTLGKEELYVIQTPIGSFSAQERAQTVSNRIKQLAEDSSISIESLTIQEQEGDSFILSSKQTILTVTEADAKAAKIPRQELIQEYLSKLKTTITDYREKRSASYIFRGIIYTFLLTVFFAIIISILLSVFPKLTTNLESLRSQSISALRLQNLEILSSSRVTDILIRFTRLVQFFLVLSLLLFYISIVLSLFHQTEKFAANLFASIVANLAFAWNAFSSYLPNLIIIFLIVVITGYIIKFARRIFDGLRSGNISIPGFYEDWIDPTYNLVVFLIIALAFAIAVPYLPGFKSPAFQGVSIFVGILVSLGSTSVVTNIVAGIILIYSRAFQIGDRITIADTTGDVVEKTLFATRIRTIKNVYITIPNAMVVGNSIVNYSFSSKSSDAPLILHTTVSLGYDIPWRKIHETLIRAALATEHILKDPAPFVLQTSLDDFYVSYQINAYTDQPAIMARIYSELHQNIQDKCNEAEIEILSPHYAAVRDGNITTIPEGYLPKDYQAPGFRVSPLDHLFNPKISKDNLETHE